MSFTKYGYCLGFFSIFSYILGLLNLRDYLALSMQIYCKEKDWKMRLFTGRKRMYVCWIARVPVQSHFQALESKQTADLKQLLAQYEAQLAEKNNKILILQIACDRERDKLRTEMANNQIVTSLRSDCSKYGFFIVVGDSRPFC
jgi:isopenicillin N synthase-like dioxygenase